MFPVPDALAAFYLTCFLVGLLFVVVSLLLGLTHDALHLPGVQHGQTDIGDGGGLDHGSLGHDTGASLNGADPDAHAGSPGDASDAASPSSAEGHGQTSATAGSATTGTGSAHHVAYHVSPFNISTAMAFITWFGGAGYILRVYAGFLGILSLVAATAAGLAGGAMIFYFLARVLLPGQRVMDPADYRMVGTVARVTVPIRVDAVGEIVYDKGGSLKSDGARSNDGSELERGTEVVVVRYERGIAYVEPWADYVRRG